MTDKHIIIDGADVSGCEFWKKELDKTHLLMLKRQDELVKEILKNDQLKAENEKLKEGLTIIDDETLVVEITKQQFEEYKQLKAIKDKYKQALQEIKNFIYIEKAKVVVDMEDFWEQILQKCEVINEKE